MNDSMSESANNRVIRVGSRKSQLALIQTHFVVDKLKEFHPDVQFEIVSMSTLGDKVLDRALSKIGEKSLFTKELEIALEQNLVDFVVHSLKDLPTNLPDGMVIAAVLERDDPRDAVVFHPDTEDEGKRLDLLPDNSVIGTSSLRRVAQLKRKYPQLQFESIRGNLNTRLNKLDNGDEYSAIVLARAGLTRMGWNNRIDQVLDPVSECMYAVSQGALGVECRADDSATIRLLSVLNHTDTILRCVAERAFLKSLEGGCTVPIATHTSVDTNNNDQVILSMTGGVFSLDGTQAVTSSLQRELTSSLYKQESSQIQLADYTDIYAGIIAVTVPRSDLDLSNKLGQSLADTLLKHGAKPILDKAKHDHKMEQDRVAALKSANTGNDEEKKMVPKWPNIDVQ